MSDEPQLLRIPQKFQTTGEALETAKKLDLPNVIVLSERDDGSLLFIGTEMSVANVVWLLERMKLLMLMPASFEGPVYERERHRSDR